MFPQAKNFVDYGKILNINEYNFNLENFISSLMKNYLDQYINYLIEMNTSVIYLTGGISQKIPVIFEYFETVSA